MVVDEIDIREHSAALDAGIGAYLFAFIIKDVVADNLGHGVAVEVCDCIAAAAAAETGLAAPLVFAIHILDDTAARDNLRIFAAVEVRETRETRAACEARDLDELVAALVRFELEVQDDREAAAGFILLEHDFGKLVVIHLGDAGVVREREHDVGMGRELGAVLAADRAKDVRTRVVVAAHGLGECREHEVGHVVFIDLAVAVVIGQVDDCGVVHDLVEFGIDAGLAAGHRLGRPVPFQGRLELALFGLDEAGVRVGIHFDAGVRGLVAEFVIAALVRILAVCAAGEAFLVDAELCAAVATELFGCAASRARACHLAGVVLADLPGAAAGAVTSCVVAAVNLAFHGFAYISGIAAYGIAGIWIVASRLLFGAYRHASVIRIACFVRQAAEASACGGAAVAGSPAFLCQRVACLTVAAAGVHARRFASLACAISAVFERRTCRIAE